MKNQTEIPIIKDEKIRWLIEKVNEFYEIDIKLLFSKKRENQEITDCRSIIFFNLIKHSSYSLTQAGKIFNKNHATVINAIKSYNNFNEFNVKFKNISDFIEKEFVNKFEHKKNIKEKQTDLQLISNQIFISPFRSKKDIVKMLIR